jgi:endonuclease G
MQKIIIFLCLILFIEYKPSENISNANTKDRYNYLMVKLGYTLSYNDSLHTANWVRWTFDKSDIGTTDRQNDFRPDSDLPKDFYHVTPTDYSGSHYDRGHICNSQAKTSSIKTNQETFLMTNMFPQTVKCNRGSWKHIEDLTQSWIKDNDEHLIIFAGGLGTNGKLKHGVNIPKECWKVIFGHGKTPLVYIFENDDSQKITTYTTLDSIEIKTHYKF